MTAEELRRIIPNAFETLRSAFIRQNPGAYRGAQAAMPINIEIAATFEDQPDVLLMQFIVLSESTLITLNEDAFVNLSIA